MMNVAQSPNGDVRFRVVAGELHRTCAAFVIGAAVVFRARDVRQRGFGLRARHTEGE